MYDLLITVRWHSLSEALCKRLSGQYRIHLCETPESALECLSQVRPQVVIADATVFWTPEAPHILIPQPQPAAVLLITPLVQEPYLTALCTAGAQLLWHPLASLAASCGRCPKLPQKCPTRINLI